MMFWTRSAGIVDCVWLAWIVLPGGSVLPCEPGSQSTKYSPISDCGRDWQNASEWNCPKPFWLACTVTSACSGLSQRAFGSLEQRLIVLIAPEITPATLKSAPLTNPNALSSSILYVGSPLPPEAPSVSAR